MKFYWNNNIKENKKFIKNSIIELINEVNLDNNTHCIEINNYSVIFHRHNSEIYIIRKSNKIIKDDCHSIFEKIDNSFIGKSGYTFYGGIIEKEYSEAIKFSHICWGLSRINNKWVFWKKLLNGYKNDENYILLKNKIFKLLEILNNDDSILIDKDTKNIFNLI